MFAASQLQIGAYRRALVCCSQLASFAFFPPWANPAAMRRDQGHLRWILSDGAGAVALEVAEACDIGIRFHLESNGTTRPPGMWISVGTAYPDLRHAFASGAHHITQPPLAAIKRGIRLASEGLGRMLRAAELPGTAVDHFIPSVSSGQIERHLQRSFTKHGIRADAWRTNFRRTGYVGSVATLIMLDELARERRLAPGDTICTVAEESSKWMFAGMLFRWNP
jgi:3-oxoacyl-[acyl-carrier-protein] synthase III